MCEVFRGGRGGERGGRKGGKREGVERMLKPTITSVIMHCLHLSFFGASSLIYITPKKIM